MGWQDRDWAKLDRSEFDAIYGSRPTLGPPPLGRSSSSVVRRGAWPAIVVSVLAAVALSRLHVLHMPALHGSASTPTVYGQPLQDGSVCTHLKLFPGSKWKCLDALVPPQGASRSAHVVVPPTYQGACTELVADQTTGRWLCVGATSAGSIPS